MDNPASGAIGSAQVRRVSFHGNGGTLFGIFIVNLLLTVVTLGIYHFWAKTRVRNYLYSETEFEGDRFAYHGTGKELFIGWLKAMLLFVVLLAVIAVLQVVLGEFLGQTLGPSLVYLFIGLPVVPIAIVGARRYRLSRTSWRGIRFSFRGRLKEFIKIYVPGLLLTIITLGLYYPYFRVNTWRFLVGHACFGTTQFEFDGKGADLFGRYILAIVFSILTLGIYWIWFSAEMHRYQWTHTSVSTARFRSTVTGGGLFGLKLVNLLMLVFTLGLAQPWVMVRTVQFVLDNLAVEGSLDLEAIQQDAQAASATGEGLSEFLDLDFLDIDLGF